MSRATISSPTLFIYLTVPTYPRTHQYLQLGADQQRLRTTSSVVPTEFALQRHSRSVQGLRGRGSRFGRVSAGRVGPKASATGGARERGVGNRTDDVRGQAKDHRLGGDERGDRGADRTRIVSELVPGKYATHEEERVVDRYLCLVPGSHIGIVYARQQWLSESDCRFSSGFLFCGWRGRRSDNRDLVLHYSCEWRVQ